MSYSCSPVVPVVFCSHAQVNGKMAMVIFLGTMVHSSLRILTSVKIAAVVYGEGLKVDRCL